MDRLMGRLLWLLHSGKPKWVELGIGGLLQLLYQHVQAARKSVPHHDPTLAIIASFLSLKTLADSLCSSKAMLVTTATAVLGPLQSCPAQLELSLLYLSLGICVEQQALDNATDGVSFFQVPPRLADRSRLSVCLNRRLP